MSNIIIVIKFRYSVFAPFEEILLVAGGGGQLTSSPFLLQLKKVFPVAGVIKISMTTNYTERTKKSLHEESLFASQNVTFYKYSAE